MSYSLSQLDAIGDVDPVAEADVYLAYGRDLQAEEILKDKRRLNNILSKHTGKSVELIEGETERDRYMDAFEAKEYGLIDQVIARRS